MVPKVGGAWPGQADAPPLEETGREREDERADGPEREQIRGDQRAAVAQGPVGCGRRNRTQKGRGLGRRWDWRWLKWPSVVGDGVVCPFRTSLETKVE